MDGKENGSDRNDKGAVHAGVQAGGGSAGQDGPRTFGDDVGLEILAVTPPPLPTVSQTLVRSVHVSTSS